MVDSELFGSSCFSEPSLVGYLDSWKKVSSLWIFPVRVTWLINSRGIANKVRNATKISNNPIKDLGAEANRECPNCKHIIDNSDLTAEWPGLPAGVKFDPSDLELLEHLAGKTGVGNSKPHQFIDEFIPTLEGDQGICYTHPENLPGAMKDGRSIHFFHRTSNAYATGQRKRRKINSGSSMTEERVRWHKTGKTKPVFENGLQIGWKKIMVLYKSSKRGCKPDKANWVMHQYHLGIEEDERDGEMVVSKILYQLQSKQIDKSEVDTINEEFVASSSRYSPKTPKSSTPQPLRQRTSSPDDYDDHVQILPCISLQELCPEHDITQCPGSNFPLKEQILHSTCLAGESQAVDGPKPANFEESLLCHEVLDSFPPFYGSGFSDLDNIELGSPPDFNLADLHFGSQESITSWLDRL